MDDEDYRLFWLNGMAGGGKSIIAQTVAEYAFALGLLGASFFCSRDSADRSNIKLIFPSISFQLAYRFPDFRAQVLSTLRSDPDISHASISVQFDKLIVEPLKATGLSTIVVLDALDECNDDEPVSTILSLLSRQIQSMPNVKIFITSRPSPNLRILDPVTPASNKGFHSPWNCGITG